MPQPADVLPPPPPAPPAPPGQPVAVDIGQGAIPLENLPRTTQQLQGLRERREILRDQLDRAQNRREETLRQLNNDGEGRLSPEARVGIQQRLTQLDQRILQIERDQATTEQLLSNAPADVLARAAQEERQRDNRNRVDEDEAVGAAFGAFGFGVVLTLVLSRIRRRFARRRAAKLGVANPAVAAADDPRIERLAQAVDAIAEEVERIGEGQRFVTQLLGRQQHATQPIALERDRG
jgi:hypothetical protein